MSESTSATAAPTQAAPAATPTPGADPAAVATDAGDSSVGASDAGAGAADPAQTEPDPKPKKAGDRRFAHLSARAAALEAERDAAQRRADAAEALLRAGRTDTDPPATSAAATPPPRAATDVEAAASRLLADRQFQARLTEIDSAGKKELGADNWEAVKATMTGLGAAGNQPFLQALAETENPAKIFAALADDTDELMTLMNKPPAAMAAKLGRMDAELSKPATTKLSGAPPPAPRVQGAGVLPNHDLYNYPANMPMSEYVKLMDAALPPHLGGKRRTA